MLLQETESVNYLHAHQWRALLQNITDPRDRALFLVAHSHGLQAREIASLEPCDVRWHPPTITLRRRGGPYSREIPLLPEESRALMAWLRVPRSPTEALFPSRNHRPISRRRLDFLMKQYCAAAGIPREKAKFRVLRNSCAMELARGGDAWLLADWVGFRDVRTAYHYMRQPNVRQAQAVRDENDAKRREK